MEGIFLFGGATIGLLPIVVLLGVVVVLALRQDDDVDEQRGPAIYASVVAFVALLTLLVAVTGVVSALVAFTEDTETSSFRSRVEVDADLRGSFGDDAGDLPGSFGEDGSDGDHDDDWRALAAFAIAGAAAVGVLALHRPLLERRETWTGAARRVYRAYLALVCVVTVVLAVGAAAVLVYDVLQLLAPGVFGDGDRGDAGREALPVLVLFGASAALWSWHSAQLGIGPPRREVSAADAP